MAFKYKGREADDIKREANMRSGGFDSIWKQGVTVFRPHDGENTIRILPGNSTWDEKKWGNNWGINLWVHREVGADNGTYICINKMFGKPCAICDALAEADDDDGKNMKPSLVVATYIIDRDAEKEGVQVWSMPQSKISKEIQSRSTDRKSGAAILVDDPDEGHDIFFKKVGSKRNTSYEGVELDRDPSPLSEKVSRQEAWLEYIQEHKLHDWFNIYDYEYLEKVVKGKSSRREKAADDDDDEDEKSSRRGRGRRDDDEEDDRRASHRTRGRDEEEEEEKPRSRRSRDDDDEEDEKPSRRRSRQEDDDEEQEEKPRSRRSRDDDDDEDEPKKRAKRVDEDDEDEKPKRRARLHDEDEEDEKPSRRTRGRTSDDEDEEDEKPKSRKRTSPDEDDDEPPFDTDDAPPKKTSRSSRADEAEEEEDVTKQVKGKLKRLRSVGK